MQKSRPVRPKVSCKHLPIAIDMHLSDYFLIISLQSATNSKTNSKFETKIMASYPNDAPIKLNGVDLVFFYMKNIKLKRNIYAFQ